MAERKDTKEQAMVYKILQRKLKNSSLGRFGTIKLAYPRHIIFEVRVPSQESE
jgi:hypothetical protein